VTGLSATGDFSFGRFAVQVGARQLLIDGVPARIGARDFDLLLALIERRDRVVTKSELLTIVWPGQVVEENTLHVHISALRKLLGPGSFVTIPGRGYRFTPELHSAMPAHVPADSGLAPGAAVAARAAGSTLPLSRAAAQPSEAGRSASAERKKSRLGLWLALAFAACAVLGSLAFGIFLNKDTTVPEQLVAAPLAPERSIAVLPFVDLSEKRDQEILADGLSEDVLDLLSRVPGLRVVARTSAFSFKGKSDDVPTIARRLSVANVLEGSIRKSGNSLRINVQLVRADSGIHLWSQSYSRKFDDILKIQDEIAASVVQALNVTLLGEGLPRFMATDNVEAYTLYLQGRSLSAHATNKADWAKVAESAQQSVKLDPTFALAWCLVSRVLSAQAHFGYIPSANGWEEARSAATRALVLSPQLSEAHLAMASILIRHDWNWAAAQTQIDQVLVHDPGNRLALNWAGYLATALGDEDRAITFYENAIASDPLDAKAYTLLAQPLYLKGNWIEAKNALVSALALDDGQPLAHWTLGRIALAKGDPVAALAEFDHEPFEEIRLVGRAISLHAQGRGTDSDAALSELEQKYAEHDAADVAIVYAFRGQNDLAFSWLDRGYQERDTDCVFVKVDPLLNKIRPDARYNAFLRKMKLTV
jgi:TolB-like protein/DNA-binding winged helix-turn-helix (wHTH) protein